MTKDLSKAMSELKRVYAIQYNPYEVIADLQRKLDRVEQSNKGHTAKETKRKNLKKHLC